MSNRYLIPEVKDVIKRKRLNDLFEKNSSKNVFIITGQPAQGKSALAASFLDSSRHNSVWMNLDKKHSSYRELYYLLSDAVSQKIKNRKKFKKIGVPKLILGTRENISRYAHALDDLFSTIGCEFNLVLDDLELFHKNASSFQLLGNLIKELPLNIRLFLISRTMPPLNIENLKLENRVFVLYNDDLAFTCDETALFIKTRTAVEVDKEKIKKIYSATEGWIGGIVLLSEAIRENPEMLRPLENLTQKLVNYFSRHVYAQLSENTRDFLLKICFFYEIDSETAIKFTKNPDSENILHDLAKRNLFIQRVETSSKGSFFHLHKLFRTFLVKILKEKKDKDQVLRLKLKAAWVFKEKGDLENSIRYFIEAGDFEQAGEMIKRIGTDLVIKGSFKDLGQLIKRLPESFVWKDPWLIFYLTTTRRIKGGEKNIKDFKTAFDLFSQKKDLRGSILSSAYLIEAAVFIRKSSDFISEWIKNGENLLKSVKDKTVYTWARAVLWQQIGFGHIAGDCEVVKGISACRNAIILGKKIENVDIQLDSYIIIILGYICKGNFNKAEQMIDEIRDLTREGIHPEYSALKNLINIDLALRKGKFQTAETYIKITEKDIEKFGLIFLYPGFIEAKAMHKLYTGKHEQAMQLSEHLSDFSILSGNMFYQGVSSRLKAAVLYHGGEFEKAGRKALKSIEIFSRKKADNIHYFMARLVFGLALVCSREFDKAKEELYCAFKGFKSISSDMFAAETQACLGLLFWELGKSDRAVEYISKAAEKAAKENYTHFLLMRPEDFTRFILIAASFNTQDTVWKYTKFMVSQKVAQHVKNQVDSFLTGPFYQNRVVPKKRLKRICKFCMPEIRILSLGQFKAVINGKEMGKSRWLGNKPRLLLKSILIHNGRDIPKEILIEDLWPETSHKSGEKKFKVTLHRLRKTFEQDLEKIAWHTYVKVEAGLVSLDPDLVTVDLNEFADFSEKGDTCSKTENFKDALFYYEKAVRLYKGDFLEEQPYTEWIGRKRENIKAEYIDLLMKKAEIHEEISQNQEAIKTLKKVIEKDPLFEPAYQNLMIVYADSGMINQAFDIFKKCKHRIFNELETEPDRKTIRIYDKIRSIQH